MPPLLVEDAPRVISSLIFWVSVLGGFVLLSPECILGILELFVRFSGGLKVALGEAVFIVGAYVVG